MTQLTDKDKQLERVAICISYTLSELLKPMDVHIADGSVYTDVGQSLSLNNDEWSVTVEGWRMQGDPKSDLYPCETQTVYRGNSPLDAVRSMIAWILNASDFNELSDTQQQVIVRALAHWFA